MLFFFLFPFVPQGLIHCQGTMTQLAIPFDGTETIDTLRAENLTLKIEFNKLEQDVVSLRHKLQIAQSQNGSAMKQRIVINKPQSVVAERSWIGDQVSMSKASSRDSKSIVDALESQLRELTGQYSLVSQEKAALEESYRKVTAALAASLEETSILKSNQTGGSAAFFQSQIRFLHVEVERLEEQNRTTQAECVARLRAVESDCLSRVNEKDTELRALRDEVNRLRASTGTFKKGKSDIGEDIFTRCRAMEVNLAGALAEKNALQIENGELNTKLRKLELSYREKKQVTQEVQRERSVEQAAATEQSTKLAATVAILTDECSRLSRQLVEAQDILQKPKVSSCTQSDAADIADACQQCDTAVTCSASCQVDTVTHFTDPSTMSLQAVKHALEEKCIESDDTRMKLDQLTLLHQQTLATLQHSQSRLHEEMRIRGSQEVDIEQLSLKLSSLQQQVSKQCALDREKDINMERALAAERSANHKALKADEALRALQEELAAHRSDMQHVVTHQNYHAQQVHELNKKNDAQQEEIQRLRIDLEQYKYVVRAKDHELQEVIAAYQQLAKDTDIITNSKRTLEKEIELLRETVRSFEERVLTNQEHMEHLHAREQQLSLDLQSYNYEMEQLHRRLHASQSREAELEAEAHSLQQSLRAMEMATNEQYNSLAELNKQIVIRDNDAMLLRMRCDSLEKEVNQLSLSKRNDSRRLRELEDSNAQLVVRGILGQQSDLTEEVALLRESLKRVTASLEEAKRREQDLLQQIAVKEDALSVARERLEKMASDHVTTLQRLGGESSSGNDW